MCGVHTDPHTLPSAEIATMVDLCYILLNGVKRSETPNSEKYRCKNESISIATVVNGHG